MTGTGETSTQPLFQQLTWRRFTRAVRSFAGSEVGGKAAWLFAALLCLLVAINALNVVNSYVGRDFMTAIADRRMGDFIRWAMLYILVFAASTVAAVIYRFTEESLGLLWREWLTRHLVGLYLTHPTYYRLNDRLIANGEVANPDQRIADDVRAFTVTTLSFVLMLLNGTFTAVAFSGVMWSISPLLFAVAVGYATFGSILTIRLGRPLVGLNYAQLDKEANFRAELLHLRENGESVALLRHEEQLKNRLLRRIADLTENLRRIVAVNRNLGFFTTGYNYLIQIIPALVVAPLYIRGEAEFGVIPQSAMAFTHLLGAFSLIVTQFQSISSYTAVIARLGSLSEAIEQAHSVALSAMEVCEHHRRTEHCPMCHSLRGAPIVSAIAVREEDGRLAYEHLTLRSFRDGRALVTDLTVSIPHGTYVQVIGPNEEAKVALFRATAGIWDVGEGCVLRPVPDQILFLPERPYMPPGTLRELLVRPALEAAVSEEEIRAALEAFDLLPALARAGGLDAEHDWDGVFSLNEQQLLAYARLLLAAPRFAFLDRPLTILTPEQVDRILRILRARSVTYVVIGASERVPDHYDAMLELAPDGSWKWMPVEGKLASA